MGNKTSVFDKVLGVFDLTSLKNQLTAEKESNQRKVDQLFEEFWINKFLKPKESVENASQSLRKSFDLEGIPLSEERVLIHDSEHINSNIKQNLKNVSTSLLGGSVNSEIHAEITMAKSEGFSVGSLYVEASCLEIGKIIGHGSFSNVYLANRKGCFVAVKQFKRRTDDVTEAKLLIRELSVRLILQNHPNIVSTIGISNIDGLPCIITEFCSGGTLYHLLHNQKDIILPWDARIQFAIDIAQGMDFLHKLKPKVLHRDLKSPNILLEHEYKGSPWPRLKINDFGLSSIVNPIEKQQLTAEIGTCFWMAPEVVKGQHYSEKADVYSYGVLLWEVIMREIPYKDLPNLTAVIWHVGQGGRPDLTRIPAGCPIELRIIMEECIRQEQDSRPPFEEIVRKLQAIPPNK